VRAEVLQEMLVGILLGISAESDFINFHFRFLQNLGT